MKRFRVSPRSARTPAVSLALFVAAGVLVSFASPARAQTAFLRGDTDGNGVLDINDPIRLLGFLFTGTPPELSCRDASDADDSGQLDITDGIVVLHFLFLGDSAPAPPHPDCGVDPTPESPELGCLDSGSCEDTNGPPTVTLTADPATGEAPLAVTFTADADDPDDDPLSFAWDFGEGTSADSGSQVEHTYLHPGTFTARVIARDGRGGEATARATVRVAVEDGTVPPPDPSELAPPVNRTAVTPIFEATEFLYTGPDAIQTGVEPETIDPLRVAVLRGRVTDQSGMPLSGVEIAILNQPRFGRTLSRADGRFDLVVDVGSKLVVEYRRAGFLPAQRQADARVQDYTILDDVALLELDEAVTTVELSAPLPTQIARGSEVTDADGSRQAMVMFPEGTQAEMRMSDGSMEPLDSLAVRLTEYTEGNMGPKAMPAELPPTSGYTYALELSVDEALAAGASEVRFDQPLPFYVDNFLGFPVGMAVPAGYYDREAARWIASENGRVVEIVSVEDGPAALDIDGDGSAEDETELAELGITAPELERLGTLYEAGQTLWRVPITHFTPWDCNWPYGPPDDAIQPERSATLEDALEDEFCEASGSIIEVQNQVLGERVELSGTPYTLNYRSSRVPGRRQVAVHIPLTGSNLPASLQRVDLTVDIAGQRHTQSFDPLPGQETSFRWDGRDAYGRDRQGVQLASIRVAYLYPAVYREPGEFEASFARLGGAPISGSPRRSEIKVSRVTRVPLGSWDARFHGGLGGWTLDVHHAYDTKARALHHGTGKRRRADVEERTVSLVFERTVPAEDFFNERLEIESVSVGPEGGVYISGRDDVTRDENSGFIDRIAPDGSRERVLATRLSVREIAHGPDGELYFIEQFTLGRLESDGTASQLAEAADLGVNSIDGLAVDPDGAVYVSSTRARRVLKIEPDGSFAVVAGSDNTDNVGDGGPANEAFLRDPRALALGPAGELYIVTDLRIRRVTPDGIIDTVAGDGTRGVAPEDGAVAREHPFLPRGDIAMLEDGRVLAATGGLIRAIEPEGTLTTIAGGFPCDFNDPGYDDEVDGARARAICWQGSASFDVAPDGSLYFSYDVQENSFEVHQIRLLRLGPALPGAALGSFLVSDDDAPAAYLFERNGRHLSTLDSRTGVVLREFDYDDQGLLVAVRESSAGVTTIERDAAGNATAIVGPFGERSTLTLDENGFLQSLEDPAGGVLTFEKTEDGLLTRWQDRRGVEKTYAYDDSGDLVQAADAEGGIQDFERTSSERGYEVTRTTALEQTTRLAVTKRADGTAAHTLTLPDGLEVEVEANRESGVSTATYPGGTQVQAISRSDPQLGSERSHLSSFSILLPSGKELTGSLSRSAEFAEEDPADTDAFNLLQLRDEITVASRTTTVVRDLEARTVTLTSPEGRSYTLTLDELGRIVGLDNPALASTVVRYAGAGGTAKVTTTAEERVRSMTLELDEHGRVQQITDPLGNTVSHEFDALGRRVATTRPDGERVLFERDEEGNILAITAPGGRRWEFSHDARGELESVTPPGGDESERTVYVIDADGRLESVHRPGEEVLALHYDELGRLESRAFSRAGELLGTFTYEFDDAGRLATQTAPSGLRVSHEYDGYLPTSQVWSGPVSGRVSRTYDEAFRIASESVNGGATIEYLWDDDGFLLAAGELAIHRDPDTGAATGATLGDVTESWSHDAFGSIDSHEVAIGGATLLSVEYTRDAIGRILERRETVDDVTTVEEFGYDVLGRLLEVRRDGLIVEAYEYDVNHNRTRAALAGVERSSTHDLADRLLTDGELEYEHDPSGRRISVTGPGGTTTYSYGANGILEAAELADGRRIEYVLDAQGRRVAKRVDGELVQGFLYQDLQNIVAELDGNGELVSRFVYSGGTSPTWMVRDGRRYRMIHDGVGSVRFVIDVESGEIAQQLDYDAFGGVLLDTRPGFQPFGFAGGLLDRDTGLVQMGVREYDPRSGRFTRMDPIGIAGGSTNLYTYALNDPVNGSDPSGLESLDWGSFWTGVGVGVVEGAVGVLDVTGIPTSVGLVWENWRQALNGWGLTQIDGDLLDLLTDLLDLEDFFDRDSTEFLVGEICGMIAGGAAAGGGLNAAARSAGRGAGGASSHFVRNKAAEAARKARRNFTRGDAEDLLRDKLDPENARRFARELTKNAAEEWGVRGSSGQATPTNGPGVGAQNAVGGTKL